MGDRCYLHVKVHKDDKERLLEILPDQPDTEDVDESHPHLLDLTWEEANYGYSNDLHRAADSGLRFIATNTSGCEYGEGIIVAYKGEHEDLPACDGLPMVGIETDGSISPESIARGRRHVELMRKVEAGD